jgi:hypothetical protein
MRNFVTKISTIITGLLIPLALPMAAFAVSTVTVTPDNPDDWSTTDSTTAGGVFNYSTEFGAPQSLGQGSLVLTTRDASSKIQYFHPANNISLSNLNISYYTYRPAGSTATPGQVAALNLVIDYNGNASGGFDTLVFEPIYQNDQTVQTDTWQNWNAGGSGIWWSTRTIPGVCQSSCYVTLATIAAANPDAVVQAFGFNQGSGNANLTSAVDGLTFNNWQYDFEPYVVANSKNDCKNNGFSNVRDSHGNAFKNQGACVSWVEHNANGNGQGNQGQVQGANTTNSTNNTSNGSSNAQNTGSY